MTEELKKKIEEACNVTFSVTASADVMPILMKRVEGIEHIPFIVEIKMVKKGLWCLSITTEGKYLSSITEKFFVL